MFLIRKKSKQKKLAKKIGFTLIEILVVSTIIALLAAVGMVTYTQINKQSRDAKRKADLEQIRAALEMYRSDSDNNQYYSGSFNDNCQNIGWLTDYISTLPDDPKSGSGYYYWCVISANDYTVAAYLESSQSVCGLGLTYSCGPNNCNYCLGPYGQK